MLVHRRRTNNARNQHVGLVMTPNVYGTSTDDARVQTLSPSPRSSLYPDMTLIDNDLYTTEENSRPTPSNMVEMSPMEQRPAPPVYAVVHKNRPDNIVVQSEASAPASPSSASIDHDTTLIDNDLYE